jgi:hypothetical protein
MSNTIEAVNKVITPVADEFFRLYHELISHRHYHEQFDQIGLEGAIDRLNDWDQQVCDAKNELRIDDFGVGDKLEKAYYEKITSKAEEDAIIKVMGALFDNPGQFFDHFFDALTTMPIEEVPEVYFHVSEVSSRLFEVDNPYQNCRDAASIITRYLKKQLPEHDVKIVPGVVIIEIKNTSTPTSSYSYHYSTVVDDSVYVDATLGQLWATMEDKILVTNDKLELMGNGIHMDDFVTPISKIMSDIGVSFSTSLRGLFRYHREHPNVDNGYDKRKLADLVMYAQDIDNLDRIVSRLDEVLAGSIRSGMTNRNRSNGYVLHSFI